MGMNRRRFVRCAGLGVAAGFGGVGKLSAGVGKLSAFARGSSPSLGAAGSTSPAGANSAASPAYGPLLDDAVRLVVLHTNDTHSRLDPFPADDGPFAGLGGAARRATLVQRVRDANEHVLLLDSGDIFQGTPYFNFFGGELEFRVMTAMGYDVATLGNHDFDNGVDGLVAMLPEAEFDFVCANYDVSDPALAARVQPWTVREFDGVKVGIFGLGIGFDGLVLESLHKGVEYRDPVQAARTTARALRGQGCALVICLSHLGYRYRNPNRPSDRVVAEAVPEVDLVLGGHTHTFLDEAESFEHGRNGFTLVNQAGWGGMRLGRIDVSFDSSGEPSDWASVGYEIDDRYDA